jgi:hypothetical protein
MKYETIGGELKDTGEVFMCLRDLQVGDKFKTKSSKHVFEVSGYKCIFSLSAGSSVRQCVNLTNGSVESKLCRIAVQKLEVKK